MKISVCIPCMNRLEDLTKTLPYTISAATNSPPVEIVIIDYNSTNRIQYEKMFEGESNVSMIVKRYEGRDHFHMAHARNLSVLASSGEYVIISSADIIFASDYIKMIRKYINEGYSWLYHSDTYIGVLAIERQNFIDAGGFDERFEFYGKEDKDLFARLVRRDIKRIQIPDKLDLIYTPWDKKLVNYRGNLSRRQMGKISKAIYEENIANKILIANEGKEWGKWE